MGYREEVEQKDRRQADHVEAQITTAERALATAIREAQKHPMSATTLRFLELSAVALEQAGEYCRAEMVIEEPGGETAANMISDMYITLSGKADGT